MAGWTLSLAEVLLDWWHRIARRNRAPLRVLVHCRACADDVVLDVPPDNLPNWPIRIQAEHMADDSHRWLSWHG
jgi:hypothetical protein